MSSERCAVLLPLDRARVVVPQEAPAEIVLKHRDGELIRATPTINPDTYETERRYELDATWTHSKTGHLAEALATVTDMQAMGWVRDGTPATLADTHRAADDELLEVEPLDRGGLVVDSDDHLPVVVHRRDHTYWRVRVVTEDIPSEAVPDRGPEPSHAYVLETRNEDEDSWRLVDAFHSDWQAHGAVEELADAAGLDSLVDDPSAAALRDTLDQHAFWFDEASDQEFRERMGIPRDTVLFEDEVPDDLSFGR
jgi:hypothetical protein